MKDRIHYLAQRGICQFVIMEGNMAARNFLFILLIGLHPILGFSLTYHLSPLGKDSYSTIQAQNESTPWKTFSKAFGLMSAGDELLLLDGVYSEAAGTGYISYLGTGSAQPPSGISKTQPTIVRVKNPGQVKVLGALFIGRSTRKDQFIRIQGITFEGGGALYNTSYIYIKECGFHSTNQSGGTVFGIGTNDHEYGNSYNLVEDCWIWGQERLIAINYRSDNNIWRRVVVRGDGCSSGACAGSSNPNVGITVYDSRDVSFQNIIVVDRILGGGSPYSDFACAQHTVESHWFGPNEWLGCISLKAPDSGWYLEPDYSNDNTYTVTNCIAWDSAGAGFNSQNSSSATEKIRNIKLTHFTTGNAGADGIRIMRIDTGTVQNVISYNAGRYGINSSITPSYCDVFGSAEQAYYQTSCSIGAKTSNPLNDGTPPSLKYLIKIEDGSALSGSGNGGDYGANVLKRYGQDGAFYGDSNYNTLSSADLWPWPNEDRIQNDMQATSTRGFCAAGQSLTSYIWEYLGNSLGGSVPPDSTRPAAPTGLRLKNPE
jgi:hypothetical protein